MADKLPPMTEAAFKRQVIQLAHLHSWKVAHFRPARTAHGWRTAVQADGAGFPDLTLLHREMRRLLFAELKSETGNLTPAQFEWVRILNECGVEVYVWRPSDWDRIRAVLEGGR